METSPDITYLARADIARLGLTPAICLPAVEAAFAAMAQGRAVNGAKVGLFASGTSFSYAMPALMREAGVAGVAGVKWVSGADNTGRDLPNISGVIVLSDVATGAVTAILDGDLITAARTAAVTLAGARRLARPDSARIGFVACGVLAYAHLDAMRAFFPLSDLVCFSRNQATAERFAETARAKGIPARVVGTSAEAVAERDIVITGVPRGPDLLQDLSPTLLAPGCFVGAPDLARSWIGDSIGGFDRILTEDVEQSRQLGQKGMIPWTERFDAGLADLITGGCDWRPDPTMRTMFVHAGVGLTDIAVASLALERARAAGIGTTLRR